MHTSVEDFIDDSDVSEDEIDVSEDESDVSEDESEFSDESDDEYIPHKRQKMDSCELTIVNESVSSNFDYPDLNICLGMKIVKLILLKK